MTATDQTGILVTGRGQVTATPDTSRVDVGVSVLGESASDATDAAAAAASAVIHSLVAEGVERSDISTSGYTLGIEYEYAGNERRIAGYRVNNNLVVLIRGIDDVGAMVDVMVAAGGDAVVISGLTFTIEDDTAHLVEARRLAWSDALDKAEHIAELAGLTLGKPISITESTSPPPPSPMTRLMSVESGTPIEPGTATMTTTMQVRFAID